MHCIGLVDEGLCKAIEDMICEQSYRETAASVSELTGQIITHQAVWDIVQQSQHNKRCLREKGDFTLFCRATSQQFVVLL